MWNVKSSVFSVYVHQVDEQQKLAYMYRRSCYFNIEKEQSVLFQHKLAKHKQSQSQLPVNEVNKFPIFMLEKQICR